jgi:hypothetical protein
VRQSLPAFDMHVGAGTLPQGTLDSEEVTFRQRYGETVHHRTIDYVKTVGGIQMID